MQRAPCAGVPRTAAQAETSRQKRGEETERPEETAERKSPGKTVPARAARLLFPRPKAATTPALPLSHQNAKARTTTGTGFCLFRHGLPGVFGIIPLKVRSLQAGMKNEILRKYGVGVS